MAKTLGLIGGTGPESTIEYYRLLVAKYRERADGNSPSLIINSVNLKNMIEWMTAGELGKVAEYLSDAIDKLRLAGADVATVPPAVLKSLVKHPLTDKGLELFLADWKKTGQSIV